MIYLITGTNRGFGLELVREGLKLWHATIAACHNIKGELPAPAKTYPDNMYIQHMGVADTKSVEQAFNDIVEKFKNFNGFINYDHEGNFLTEKYYK
jgi:NAD(P)-dependent dehydrogenase (short-subunit alcohol dehydrogenase family)